MSRGGGQRGWCWWQGTFQEGIEGGKHDRNMETVEAHVDEVGL